MINLLMTLERPGVLTDVLKALSPATLVAGEAAAMLDATEYVKGQLVHSFPVAASSEHTRDRIFTSIGGTPLNLEGLVASPDIAARVLEFGRTPGAKMPPSSALEDWTGLELGDSRLAYVVARSIARKGTEPRFIFRSVMERTGTKVRDIFTKALGLL